ncbi:hypothetical protein C0J45_21963 [Silurus meridionalis]|uniref:Uncharacterized protein n=1 Tax=Silurus meridionalis TaxID=175797 RepID=A0A8T0A746_SILME|nr:hypothetical protein HF521_014742 [Silurus meridionalis]KAI5088420.1 hypothetical protein C0J45_21963 [Silurus meridionalis]
MGRVVLGRASRLKHVPNQICGSRKRNSYRIGRGPGYQRPPQVSLTNRVPVEIGLLLAEGGEGEEVADMMERRKVDMVCVQETKWKGSNTRNIGGGFKLFYHGVDGKRNGLGVILLFLKEEFSKCVVEVKRVSERVMNLKLEFEGAMMNVISAYAPQVGCEIDGEGKILD